MPIFETEERRVLFVHIPRTGGSSIENWLSEHVGMGFFATMPPASLRVCPQHLGIDDLGILMGALTWDWAFSVIRNPYERMESEYFFRMSRLRNPTGQLPDFSVWVQRQLKQYESNPFLLDNHVRPQSDFLDTGVKIFRYEDGLEAIQAEVSRYLGIEIPGFIRRLNASERKNVRWSNQTLNAFNQFYRADFRQLGYEQKESSLDISTP